MTDTTSQSAGNTLMGFIGIGLIAFVAYLYGRGVSEPNHNPVLATGQDAVLSHFVDQGNWGPVECRPGRHDGFNTLYCHPDGNTRRGGLYIIGREGEAPIVYPINGTGMGQMRQAAIRASNGSRVAVREWDGPEINIRAAIDSTL